MMARSLWYLDTLFSHKKIKKKRCQSWTPSDKKNSGSAHECYSLRHRHMYRFSNKYASQFKMFGIEEK